MPHFDDELPKSDRELYEIDLLALAQPNNQDPEIQSRLKISIAAYESKHRTPARVAPPAPASDDRSLAQIEFEAELCRAHGYQPTTLRGMRLGDSYEGIALPLAWAMFLKARELPAQPTPNFYQQVIEEISDGGIGKTITGILRQRVHQLQAEWFKSNPPPQIRSTDIDRWHKATMEAPEGPWNIANGGSFDRTRIKPISDEMLEELAHWFRMGYTPWNGRHCSTADRQYMYLLYYSVQGLVSRVRTAERALQENLSAEEVDSIVTALYENDRLDEWCGHDVSADALRNIIFRIHAFIGSRKP